MRFAFLGCQVRFIVKTAFLGFTADQTAGAALQATAVRLSVRGSTRRPQ